MLPDVDGRASEIILILSPAPPVGPKAGRKGSEMKINFDPVEREYIFDHGGWLDANGMAVMPKARFEKAQYTGWSVRKDNTRTWTIPSQHGLSLLYEGEHFRVEG